MVIVDLLWTNQACNCQRVSTSFCLEIHEWTSFLCQLLQGPHKLNKQHRFWNKNGNDIMREDVVAILTDIKRILDSTGTNRLWILQECIISSIIALRQLLLSYQGSTISESRNCGRIPEFPTIVNIWDKAQIDRRSMATGLWRAEGKLSRILLSDVQKVILFLSYVHTIDKRRSWVPTCLTDCWKLERNWKRARTWCLKSSANKVLLYIY